MTCVKVKGSKSERHKIVMGVKYGCVMFPWISIVYTDWVMKEMKMGMRRM